jgi:hypothetical protein
VTNSKLADPLGVPSFSKSILSVPGVGPDVTLTESHTNGGCDGSQDPDGLAKLMGPAGLCPLATMFQSTTVLLVAS